jgi:DNA-nicking Smr family endonuclease
MAMPDRPRRDTTSDEERSLFESEMQDVRPLDRRRSRVIEREKPAPVVTRPTADTESRPFAVEIDGERIAAFEPSVSDEVRRALRRGEPRPEAILDLHGQRSGEARRRVESFLMESRAAGRRVVVLVTGRGLRSGPGGPVLRGDVVELLTQPPLARWVLGVVSAPPAHGGTGALLVLLRKIWKEKR